MKLLHLFVASALLAFPAAAASPEQPVKSLMDLATALWSDDPKAEGQDYFDASRLDVLYSKAFAAAYREAAKYPIYDDAGGPFGYDVITNSQDGCPLEDVRIEPGPTANGTTDVKVTFKLWTCADEEGSDRNAVSEIHFDVVEEDGRPVIADIHRVVDGKPDSLLKEMQDIARTGAEQKDEPPQEEP